ncbi:hypothetical protein EON65_32620 [archaeon]|nr:MAG: hypothetical protein EON65_32620 [archaeon]
MKRISTILTAPPKITEKEYLEMKKLCKSSKDGMHTHPSIPIPIPISIPMHADPRAKFEKELQEKKLEQFFEQVKKTGPYYSAKRWEQQYQHQV